MSPLLSARNELESFMDRSTVQFDTAFLDLSAAIARGASKDAALTRVQRTIGQSMAIADIFGRRRVFLEVDAAEKTIGPEEVDRLSRTFFAATPIVPNISFDEAFKGMIDRDPRLAPSAQLVADLYQERISFALAKSADVALTERIQGFVSVFIRDGRPEPSAAEIIRQTGDFTTAYARTVYRTNLNTAYTAGRFEQAQERGVRTVLPAMERFSVKDSSLRSGRPQDNGENHRAAAGLVLETRDPRWALYAPPSGFS